MMLDHCNDIMTVPEVARLLGTGKGSVYDLLAKGELNGFRIGRVWKIPRMAVEDYILTNSGMK